MVLQISSIAVLKSSAEMTRAMRIRIIMNSMVDIFNKKEVNKTKTVAVR